MKLYYKQAACSFGPHITLRELGADFTLDRADFKAGKTESGLSTADINPKGYVPVLELDDGQRLTEAQVILQYLADRKPELNLLPPVGTMERYRALEWLAYIATELHKGYTPIFTAAQPEEAKQLAREALAKKWAWVEQQLGDREVMLGTGFTVVDAYLYTVLGWSRLAKVDLTPFPRLLAYRKRIGQRPSVQAAMKAEGLGG